MDDPGTIDKFKILMDNVFNYLENETYPSDLSRKQKKEFRRKCSCFRSDGGILKYIGFSTKGK